MIVVLTCPTHLHRLENDWWGDWKPHISHASSVREAHLELAERAVSEGWDESVRVVQDDVYVHSWGAQVGDVTSHHKALSKRHVCPRAFTATLDGWHHLVRAWSQEGQTCELWKPDHCYDYADHRP